MKKYIVNLDLEPEERWKHIVSDHLYDLQILHLSFDYSLSIFQYLKKMWSIPIEYRRELYGISQITESIGLTYNNLLLLNSILDLKTSSFSALVNSNVILHLHCKDDINNVDLKNLTIQVDFIKQGEIRYCATTCVGFVGILSGMKPNSYSVSVDYCNDEKILNQFSFNKCYIQFMLREILEKELYFKGAIDKLKNIRLVNPCNTTLACKSNGCIIKYDNSLEYLDSKKFLVGLNPNEGFNPSSKLQEFENNFHLIHPGDLIKSSYAVLDIFPITNKNTRYKCIMYSPKHLMIGNVTYN